MPQAVEDDAPVNTKDGKVLHPDLLNENMKKCQYAVRGELYLKAEELRQQGRDIIFTNGEPLLPHVRFRRSVTEPGFAPLQLVTHMHWEPSQSPLPVRYATKKVRGHGSLFHTRGPKPLA
jgi:hypothetical protein